MKIGITPLRLFGQCLLTTAVLSACGGGGGGSADTGVVPVTPPVTSPVTPPGAVAAATIVSQPQSVSVGDGQAAVFAVTAQGAGPLSYQWLRAGVAVAGATAAQYTLPAAAMSDSGSQFSVAVTNPGGSVTSRAAALTVTALPAMVAIQPSDVVALQGEPVALTVGVTGTGPFTFQWQRSDDDGASWAAVAGATQATLSMAGAALADGGAQFRANVATALGSSTSTAARLSVRAHIGLLAGAIGGRGYVDGAAATSRLSHPRDVAVGPDGAVYVFDSSNRAIRKIAGGVVGTHASLTMPNPTQSGMAADTAGNLYFVSGNGDAVQKLSADGRSLTVVAGGSQGFADGTGAAARFCLPNGIALDGNGSVYVADACNNAIRKIDRSGLVTTLVGAPGSSTDGLLNNPLGVAIAPNGDVLVADTGNHVLRRVSAQGVVSLVAGSVGVQGSANGSAAAARFTNPVDLVVTSTNIIYVSDGNHTVRKISAAGVVSTLAGLAGSSGRQDGTGAAARFYSPTGLTLDASGNVLVTEDGNHTVRRITPGGQVSTLAGVGRAVGSANGVGATARFNEARAVAVGPDGTTYVADIYNHVIRAIDVNGNVSTLAGRLGSPGYANGAAGTAQFEYPTLVAVGPTGPVYVVENAGRRIRVIGPGGLVSALGGNHSARLFGDVTAIAVDAQGNLIVADRLAVKKITPSGQMTLVAGSVSDTTYSNTNGPALSARFYPIGALAVDAAGNIYVGSGSAVRKISAAGIVSTIAGYAPSWSDRRSEGLAAGFGTISGLAVDGKGNVFFADDHHSVNRVLPSGLVSIVIGGNWNEYAGYVAGSYETTRLGPHGMISYPRGMAITPAGRLTIVTEDAVVQTK